DVDRAREITSRYEHRERLRRVRLHVLPDPRAAEAEPHGVQRPIREHLLVLAGEELVAREELPRELRIVGREELVRVIERVAAEEAVGRRRVVVQAALDEVLIQLLIEREVELREPLPE